jgi:hypothetical protein
MSVYIYTLPKAGTYFLAKLLSNMGFNDTGYHISKFSYLDTKSYSIRENSATPGIAKVRKFFVPVVRQMEENDVAFGHFPLPLNFSVAPEHMKYLCAYRDPQKTLVSEFIDFRFRRTDLPWIMQSAIVDDRRAFELYLERHGTGAHLSIFKKIVLYHVLVNQSLTDPRERNRACFINFDVILKEPDTVRQIADFLSAPLTRSAARSVHRQTLSAETKTKAVNLTIDRDLLWTERARSLYAASDFPCTIAIAREQGLEL